MLHGASATGKSSLLQSILFSEELLHVHIDCAAFHTLKQLFTSLQYEISVLLQTKLSAKRKRVSSKQLSIQQFYGLPCSSYLEFNTFIANIFSTSITNEINFIVVFENLHTVLDYQDEDALTTLLSLQEVRVLIDILDCLA